MTSDSLRMLQGDISLLRQEADKRQRSRSTKFLISLAMAAVVFVGALAFAGWSGRQIDAPPPSSPQASRYAPETVHGSNSYIATEVTDSDVDRHERVAENDDDRHADVQELSEVIAAISEIPSSNGSEVDAPTLWARGYAKFKDGDLDAALALYREAEAEDPLRPGPINSQARVAAERRNFEQAQQLYERALGLDSNYVPALLGLATIHIRNGEPRKAKPLIDKVLKIEPDNKQALTRDARIKNLLATVEMNR